MCVKRKCKAVVSLGCEPSFLGETCVVKCAGADEILVRHVVEVTGDVQLICECEDESCETRLYKSDTYVLTFRNYFLTLLTYQIQYSYIYTRSYVCLRSVACRQLLEVSMIRVRGIVRKKPELDALATTTFRIRKH